MARAKQADEEIDLDPTAQAETTAVEPSDVADMPTPNAHAVPEAFPPDGHRWERFEAMRPDGVRVMVTRDIETGDQRVTEA